MIKSLSFIIFCFVLIQSLCADNAKEKLDQSYLDFFKSLQEMLASTANLTLEESRQASTRFFTENVELEYITRVIDLEILGLDNNSIPLRVFIPTDQAADLPVLVFFHQGGWVFGSIDDSEAICRKIANRSNCIVISVGYRLAPEHKFPKGLQDCYAAVKWAHENAKKLGGDKNYLGVGGESAGGNLAAAVALMCRDNAEIFLKYQILLYPVLASDINESAYGGCPDQSFMTLLAMKMFWDLYLNNSDDRQNHYASPLKATSFAKLPADCLITAGYDPLKHEGFQYVQGLRSAGIPLMHKNYPFAIHCFISLPLKEPKYSSEALADISKFILNIRI